MRILCLTALGLVLAGPAWAGGLRVEADARVELLSVVFRLAGHPEYNMPNAQGPYVEAVDAHFAKFADHPAVQAARLLRRDQGVSYDAPMSLAVHLRSAEKVRLRVLLDPWPESLERRWGDGARTGDFVKKLAGFAKVSGFAGFFRKQKKTLGSYHARLRARLKGQKFMGWFADLFGSKPGLKVHVVASAINGGQSYGVRFVKPGRPEELYPVIGLYEYDGRGRPVFSDAIVGLVVHEFAHSSANPLVDSCYGQLAPAVERLYAAHRQRMRSMAYGNPRILAYETLVRALVQSYLRQHGTPAQAQAHRQHLRSRGFPWSVDLADRIDAFRKKQKKPDGLKSFVPELKRFFEQVAGAER